MPESVSVQDPPRISAALDLSRYAEIGRRADLALNLWDTVRLAAERGDAPAIAQACRQISLVTRDAFALAKRLGNPNPDDG